MTMESRQPEGAGSNSDLVRSAALSSADLWHEILERLNEVQEGQLRLARAIESLGMIVCDALSVNPQCGVQRRRGDASAPAHRSNVCPLAAGPRPAGTVDQQSPPVNAIWSPPNEPSTPSLAPTSSPPRRRPDVEPAPGVPRRRWRRPGRRPRRASMSPRSRPEPQVAREPVSSGSWPRGRRVARGLGREAPTMTAPAVVPNLTPAAIDALLAAEFGDPSAVTGPPRRVVPAAQGARC